MDEQSQGSAAGVAGRHRHEVQLRFSDSDAIGHVNHARFASYLEDARVGLLLRIAGGVDVGSVILARLEIDYVLPIELAHGPVTVAVWISAIGRSSFAQGYEMEQAGRVVARGASVLVAYDYAAARPRPLSEEERQGLEEWRAAAAGPG